MDEVDLERLLVGDLWCFFGKDNNKIGEARAAVDILLERREVVLEVYRLGDQSHLEKSRLIVLESETRLILLHVVKRVFKHDYVSSRPETS